MMPLPNGRAAWLARNVLPHEPALRAWLRGRRLNGLDIDDVIQETYARLIEAPAVEHILNAKNYAFQTANSVVAAELRQMKVVCIGSIADLEQLDIVSLDPSPEHQAIDRNELSRLAEGIAALPEKMRRVFVMRRIHGFSQRDVALKMGISESTVEKHMARGLILMLDRFLNGGKGPEKASSAGSKTAKAPKQHARDSSRN
jgi:RNA polymerase sigma factor (sigma-70 family)